MMQTAKKTGKIIIAIIASNALILSVVDLSYAEEPPCDPVVGMCALPNRPAPPSDEEYLELFEAIEDDVSHPLPPRLALAERMEERLFKRQTIDCHIAPLSSNNLTLADKLAGDFSNLGEHIILKAQAAGMLLQLPSIVLDFVESCDLRSERKNFVAIKNTASEESILRR